MKHVSILVPTSAVLAAIGDPRYMFTAVNGFLAAAGKPPLFKVELVAQQPEVHLHEGCFSVHADQLMHQVSRTDLIFIPAMSGDMEMALQQNAAWIPWLVGHYQKGAALASLCNGAFLLAQTGLLKGRQCSTHWLFANDFRKRFPEVDLVDGQIVTECDGIFSSGGANSYWNLLLHLVEKYTDRATAILAAKFFAIDMERSSQDVFMMFRGQQQHPDDVILQSQIFIEKNYQHKIAVDQLAERVAMGRRNFERRFLKATNNTVLEYIQRIRIEAAKQQLENSRSNINEVMYEVGYSDAKAFRLLFKKLTGITPMAYRNKYNKQALVSLV